MTIPWWWVVLGVVGFLALVTALTLLICCRCRRTSQVLPTAAPQLHSHPKLATTHSSKSLKKSSEVPRSTATPRVIHTATFATHPTQYLSVTNLPSFIAAQTGLERPISLPITEADIDRRQTLPDPQPSPQASPLPSPQPTPELDTHHSIAGPNATPKTPHLDSNPRQLTFVSALRKSSGGTSVSTSFTAIPHIDKLYPGTAANPIVIENVDAAPPPATLMGGPNIKPTIDVSVVRTLTEDDSENGEWWQRNLSASTYRLTRELASETTVPPSPKTPQKRRDSKQSTQNVDRELTKEWARSKQSVDLLDFLRESPDDYMVKEPSRKLSDNLDDMESNTSGSMGIEVMSARGPGDKTLKRNRPSFRIDSTVAERSIQEKEASAVWGDFTLLLRSRTGLEALMEFLTANWSAENLLFYQAVDELRQTPDVNLVFVIFEDFVKNDACSMVNLRGSTQTRIIQEMERVKQAKKVTPEITQYLDDAQHEIFRLMENDLFPRFITGKHSEPWKAECRKAVSELHQKNQKLGLTRSVSSILMKRKDKSHSGSNS